jgi:hypothetical protein
MHKEFKHENEKDVKHRVAAEHGQFKDTSTTEATRHTQAVAQAQSGEHVHHHVHETIQPVIHKETIQPEVVHTTVPIHETHHIESKHHTTSTLPVKTLDDFKHAGGNLTGVGTQPLATEQYDGCPRPYNDNVPPQSHNISTQSKDLNSTGQHHGAVSRSTQPDTTIGGTTSDRNTTGGIFNSQTTEHDRSGPFNSNKHAGTEGTSTSTHPTRNQPTSGAIAASQHAASHAPAHHNTSSTHDTDIDGSGKKPSIMDRLNPLKHT